MPENPPKTIQFADYKQKILDSLNAKIVNKQLQLNGNFTLVDGFFFSTIQEKFPGVQLGGSGIPQVALVNNETGEMRFFALKKILPDIEI